LFETTSPGPGDAVGVVAHRDFGDYVEAQRRDAIGQKRGIGIDGSAFNDLIACRNQGYADPFSCFSCLGGCFRGGFRSLGRSLGHRFTAS
jgi:hypothetical protein